MTTHGIDAAPAGQAGKRWLALTVLSATQLMVILDGTVVNVALPTIQRDLGFSPTGLPWVVNAFLVAFGGLLLFAGRLGDLIGARRVFLAGVTVFTLASVLAGVANSPAMLVASRFAQGVGGALGSAVVLGMIARLYPTPAERAWAFGVFAFVGSAGASIGVVAGGVLTELADWHWIFLVNVPVGLLALAGAVRVLEPDPDRPDRQRRPAGSRARHDRPDARGLCDHPGAAARLGLDAGRRTARRRSRAARRVRAPSDDRDSAAGAARDLPITPVLGVERRPVHHGGDRIQLPVPQCLVPAGDPGLRPAPHRPGLPRDHLGDRHRLAGDVGPPGRALRVRAGCW